MALAINGTTGISGVDGSASAPAIVGSDSNTGFVFGSDTINLSTGGTTRLTVDSSGNCGIGINSPTARFDVRRSDADGLIAEFHQSAGFGIDIGSSQSVAYISSGYGQALTFKTDPSSGQVERGRFTASGSFIIPGGSETLPVVGTEKIGVNGGSASNSVGIAAAASNNNGIPFFASNSSDTSSQRLMRFAAGSGGNTRGTITFNGSAMVYGGSSDYRLKKNVTSLTNAITKLKKFNPILFDWIKETDNNNVMGFLAHEVKEIMPQVVTGEKDEVDSEGNPEYQEIDLGGMSPLIVAALQEAVAKIETLETKVAALEAA